MIIEEEEEDGDINRVHDLILKKSCVNVNDYDSRNKNNEIEYNEDYIYQRYYEGHNKGFLFWIFAKTIFISVFGDSYMLAIISNSAISNFKGTLYGSSLGILIIVYLACHHGMLIGSHLSEGKMGVVISFLYFGLAAEIFCFNTYLNINIKWDNYYIYLLLNYFCIYSLEFIKCFNAKEQKYAFWFTFSSIKI